MSANPRGNPAAIVIVAVMALALPAACSSSAGGSGPRVAGHGKVASVESPGAQATGRPDAPSQEERPQLRLDTTQQESWQLRQAWYRCLKQEGVPTFPFPGGTAGRGMPYGGPDDITIRPHNNIWADPQFVEPMKKCIGKEPRKPLEEDPLRNPHYLDQWDDMVRCIRVAGIKVSSFKGDEPDGSMDYQLGAIPPGVDSEKVTHDCELKAFSK